MLCSLLASAGDGLVAVGANVILLPSNYYDGDIEWKAWTWVYNSQTNYGDWNTDNMNYNVICGVPDDEGFYGPQADAEGRRWFEPGFDMIPKDGDLNYDVFDEETGEEIPILWEEHTAPFSSDATYNGRSSYQWTTGSIMADIYVRRTFTLDPSQLLAGPVFLACGHDDAPCEYYINGVLVFERTGYEGEWTDDDGNVHYNNGWNNAEYIQLTDEQKALINLGGEENVVAFHVHQNWGGAFADCGLYTRIEGGLDMGYTTPWEGKVLFNSIGGYNWDLQSPSNNPRHPWSPLFEAQEGDEYTFTMLTASDDETEWAEQLHFKTPIKINEDNSYTFKATLLADKPFSNVIVKLTDNDDDEIELAYDFVELEENKAKEIELDFDGQDVSNFKIAFDFGGGAEGATVTIKGLSLVEEEDMEEKELWVGTHYFNYIYMNKRVVTYRYYDPDIEVVDENGEINYGGYREPQNEEELEDSEEIITYEEADAPEIEGRVETLAWTEADFDDSMWDDQMMPVGSSGYMSELQSIWPGGDNTNYWIRRNFELDKVNERLSYELNVCHDDVYETYVNGHLLQKNVGWTDGKNPVQVHIPARYLNVGKNVIATYIQQNWGGKFYDCGINVTEVDYNDCLRQFNEAVEYAKTDTLLTNAMKANVLALIAEAEQFFQENKNDAPELRSFARELKPRVNTIFSYSADVKTLKETWDICRKMPDMGYWGTALNDATAALDTCETASQLSPYLTALRNARKATAMERHTEKYVGSVPEAVSIDEIGDWDFICPKYYIYNVGAKQFLGAGEAWGTHQALQYASNPMMLVQATQDVLDEDGEVIDYEDIEGAYYIETFRPNGNIGEMDFLGWNGFVDCPMGGNLWELIPVEGKENVYNIAQYGSTHGNDTITYNGDIFPSDCKNYIGLRNGDNRYAPSYYVVDTDMHDANLETNQWMFISREELLGFIATASETNPVDLTFLINNPGYDQRLSIDDWIFFGGSVFGRNGNHANFVLESYNSDEFQNYQELWPDEADEALPAGTYVLSVQGYYRDGIEQKHLEKVLADEEILQRSYIFAGADPYDEDTWTTMPLMPIHIEANKVPGIGYSYGGMRVPGTYGGQPMSACDQAADEYFKYGLYWNDVAFNIEKGNEGTLTIGIQKEYSEERLEGDWIVMDNWRLKYYGTDVEDPDAIKGITSDEIKGSTPKADKGIYNMLGQRLQKAQKGVNIIGGKKIVKK